MVNYASFARTIAIQPKHITQWLTRIFFYFYPHVSSKRYLHRKIRLLRAIIECEKKLFFFFEKKSEGKYNYYTFRLGTIIRTIHESMGGQKCTLCARNHFKLCYILVCFCLFFCPNSERFCFRCLYACTVCRKSYGSAPQIGRNPHYKRREEEVYTLILYIYTIMSAWKNMARIMWFVGVCTTVALVDDLETPKRPRLYGTLVERERNVAATRRLALAYRSQAGQGFSAARFVWHNSQSYFFPLYCAHAFFLLFIIMYVSLDDKYRSDN